MKEEMQGFHMTPNFEIFISEITLFWPDYTTKRITPRITPIREAQAPGVKVGHTNPARPPFATHHIFPHEVKCHNFSRVS